MLNLRDKTAQEVEQLTKQLSAKFDNDYKTLKGMAVPLPKANPGPQHVHRLTIAIGEAREFSDTASRIESRWFRMSQEAAQHHAYNEREFKKAEAAFMSSEAANMKKLALKSVEEKKAHVAANVKEPREELDILLRFKEESKGWYEYAKKVHSHIRNSQSDILTMVGILKVAIVTKQFDLDPTTTADITGTSPSDRDDTITAGDPSSGIVATGVDGVHSDPNSGIVVTGSRPEEGIGKIVGTDTSSVEREPDQVVTDPVDPPDNGVQYRDEVTSF